MLPSEMIILMAIAVDKNSGKKLLNRPMDVTGEYIGYLYNSLVNRGYLKRHRSNRYQLTLLGRKTISEFLHKNKTRARDIVKRLQLLGIELSHTKERKIGKVEKDSIKVEQKS